MTFQFQFRSPTTIAPITKNGTPVARPDRDYALDLPAKYIAFDEIVFFGDLNGELEYQGHLITICHAQAQIGQIIDQNGARGPVLQGVLVRVER